MERKEVKNGLKRGRFRQSGDRNEAPEGASLFRC
jgi:hypothetical protein